MKKVVLKVQVIVHKRMKHLDPERVPQLMKWLHFEIDENDEDEYCIWIKFKLDNKKYRVCLDDNRTKGRDNFDTIILRQLKNTKYEYYVEYGAYNDSEEFDMYMLKPEVRRFIYSKLRESQNA